MDEIEELREFFHSHQTNAGFTRRPVSIPGDYRIAWRISVLCLLISRGRSNTLTMQHLHLLWWAIRSEGSRSLFERWLDGDKSPDEFLIRFDPSLSTTLDLATGQGLVERTTTGNIQLTLPGIKLAERLGQDSTTLIAERQFLERLPKRINQRHMRELLEWN